MSPRSSPSQCGLRRGMVAVQVVLSLTVLVGVVALTVDGGLLLAERRHAQAAADAAALAGAGDLFKNYQTSAGADTSGSASAVASATASANYQAGPTNLSVTINIPPKTARSSYYNGLAGYVELDVTYNQARTFSAIWNSSRIPVNAHAIARGQWTPSDFAILTLAPTGSASFKVSGGGSVTAINGSIVIDSIDGSALKNSGGGSVTATSINIAGGASGGGTYSPAPNSNSTPIQDPLRALPDPTPPAAGSILKVSIGSGKYQYTLSPGSYDGNGGPSMPNIHSGDIVIFKQASTNSAGGIYYLYAGISTTGGTLKMDPSTTGGLMFYNAGTSPSQGFGITGNASGLVDLSGLDGSVSSTLAYKGIILFQGRSSSQDVTVSGNGSFTMQGTFYAPVASLKITGNTSTPPSIIGSQYIAYGLTVSGGGSLIVDHKSSIVAPSRFLTLVE